MENVLKMMCRLWKIIDTWAGRCGVFFLILQGIAVLSFAVDIPHADEWEMLRPYALGHRLNFSWLWKPHNEHRLVLTKLCEWVLLRCGNLHLPTQVAINFFLYTLVCWLVMRFCRRCLSGYHAFLWLPLSSTLLWEIHFWLFQTHFHLYLLFFVVALGMLMRQDAWRFSGAIFASLSILSFSSGLICALGVIVAALGVGHLRPQQRRGFIVQAVLIALVIVAWFLPSPPSSASHMHAWPWSKAFIVHLGSTWARGFGINQMAPFWLGWIVIFLGLYLSFLQVRRLRGATRDVKETWLMVLVFGAVMFVCTAVTSFGRGNLAGMTQYIAPRYLENVVLCIPVLWALWCQAVSHRAVYLLLSSLFVLAPFVDEMNARHTYARQHAKLVELRACADAYFRGDNEGICSGDKAFDDGHLSHVFDRAKDLGLSFTETGYVDHFRKKKE